MHLFGPPPQKKNDRNSRMDGQPGCNYSTYVQGFRWPNVDADHVLEKPDIDFCHKITCGKTQCRDGFGLMFMTPKQQIRRGDKNSLSSLFQHTAATAFQLLRFPIAIPIMRSPGRSILSSVGADRGKIAVEP